MRTSDSIKAIGAALSAFQAEVKNPRTSKEVRVPGKDGKPGYSYHYAPLNEVMDSIRPLLGKHGLSVIQSTASVPIDINKVMSYSPTVQVERVTVMSPTVTTRIIHSSGEWIESDEISFVVAGTGAQEIGSAISYARRYQLAGLLGISPDDDDDASGADGVPSAITPKAPQAPAPAKPAAPARGFGEVDLSAGGPTLAEALAYTPFKSGADMGKPMAQIGDPKLIWLAGNEKTSPRTKQMAMMVLESRKKELASLEEAGEEPMAEEPPEGLIPFASTYKDGRD